MKKRIISASVAISLLLSTCPTLTSANNTIPVNSSAPSISSEVNNADASSISSPGFFAKAGNTFSNLGSSTVSGLSKFGSYTARGVSGLFNSGVSKLNAHRSERLKSEKKAIEKAVNNNYNELHKGHLIKTHFNGLLGAINKDVTDFITNHLKSTIGVTVLATAAIICSIYGIYHIRNTKTETKNSKEVENSSAEKTFSTQKALA